MITTRWTNHYKGVSKFSCNDWLIKIPIMDCDTHQHIKLYSVQHHTQATPRKFPKPPSTTACSVHRHLWELQNWRYPQCCQTLSWDMKPESLEAQEEIFSWMWRCFYKEYTVCTNIYIHLYIYIYNTSVQWDPLRQSPLKHLRFQPFSGHAIGASRGWWVQTDACNSKW